MKKRISLILCVLAAMLCFTGCASETAGVEYDKESVSQVADFLIEYCASADEATIEQWDSMTEFSLEQQLTEAGLPFTPESFLASMDAWTAGVGDCGEYIGHGDYNYEASATGLTVTTDAQFQDRDATITFVFDERIYLESMTIDAEYSTAEILEKAGMNTLLGMGTVFAVLILISIIISLFKFIPKLEQAFKKKPKEEAAVETTVEAPVAAPAPVSDNTELIAVIAAAIAASEGTSTDGFVVRSIKRRPSNKWNS